MLGDADLKQARLSRHPIELIVGPSGCTHGLPNVLLPQQVRPGTRLDGEVTVVLAAPISDRLDCLEIRIVEGRVVARHREGRMLGIPLVMAPHEAGGVPAADRRLCAKQWRVQTLGTLPSMLKIPTWQSAVPGHRDWPERGS
jgi:hypothetical protein